MTTNPYRQASFMLGAHEVSQFPADAGAEVAFVGRSNVGKSSVMNAITDNRGLARTSKTPGRTRQINFFEVAPGRRLVDLPGYGFARVDQATRRHWYGVINAYLVGRSSLAGLILIIDIRRELSAEDRLILDWAGSAGVPVHVLANKADKLPAGRRKARIIALRRELENTEADCQPFSVPARSGVESARERLTAWLEKKAGPG